MKMPNAAQAVVPERKITEYLLSETHPEGKYKAAFFGQFGFDSWQQLATALLQHAQTQEVFRFVTTEHGTKYIIEGALSTPDERNPGVRSVWIVVNGSDIPQLVTAYRLKGTS